MRDSHPIQTGHDLVSRVIRVLLVGILCGTAASLAALILVFSVSGISQWITALKQNTPGLLSILLTISIPSLGGLIVGKIVYSTRIQRPQTPADVLLAAQSNLKLSSLKLKDSLLNFLSAIISLASGASLGEYGPMVNIGAALSAKLQKISRTEPTILIGCGVAAAISAGFHAPIAGVIFAHEAIIRHYSLRAFAPITIAASISFYISKAVFHTDYLLQFEFPKINYLGEYAGFILVGLLSGLLAVVFLRSMLYARLLAGKIPVAAQFKPAIAGLLIGLLALQLPDILGIGDQLMRQTLSDTAPSAISLGILLIAKITAAAICLGFGFVGGVFSPSLLIGLLFGSLLGLGIEQLFPYANIPMYAICGMAAVTSPVIGAPLTTIMIVFELTHSYDLTTAVMVSVVFSNVVSYRLFGRSLFDFQLKIRGYDLAHGRDSLIMDTLSIQDISHANFITVRLGSPVKEAIDQLVEAHANEAFALDHAQRFSGSISLVDLIQLADQNGPDAPIDNIVNRHCLSFSPTCSVWRAMNNIKGFVGEAVPIVDEQSELLIGIIHETDLIDAYMRTTRELRNEETANA